MTKLASIINMKGGVGKTTLTFNLASYLAELNDQRVLVIDLDPQANATVVSTEEDKYKAHLASKKTVADVFVHAYKTYGPVRSPKVGDLDLKDFLYEVYKSKSSNGRFDLIPSELMLSSVLKGMTLGPYDLDKLLTPQVRQQYDYILLDCAPTNSSLTTVALNTTQSVLIPMISDSLEHMGRCQVVRVEPKDIEVVALDHISDKLPSLGEVSRAPLVQDSYFWDVEMLHERVVGAPPKDFVSLGVCGPVVARDPPSKHYGHWESVRSTVTYYRRWRRSPESARVPAFRAAVATREKRRLSLPGGPVTAFAHASHLLVATGQTLAPLNAFRVADVSKLDWRVFDALPAVSRTSRSTVTRRGCSRGSRQRPIVLELMWRDCAEPSLDLSGFTLSSVAVGPRGPCEITLPPSIEKFTLLGDDRSAVAVRVPDAVTSLELGVETRDGRSLSLLSGASKATSLDVNSFASFDCAALSDFTALRSAAGAQQPERRARGSRHLAAFSSLETLSIRTCRSIDVDEMPPLTAWPAMERLLVWGAHEADSAKLKSHWGRTRTVSVTSPQKASWFAAHPSHPLLHWAHYAGAPQACGAFATAMRSLTTGRDPVRTLQTFARAIEKLDATRAVRFSDDERADPRAHLGHPRRAGRGPQGARDHRVTAFGCVYGRVVPVDTMSIHPLRAHSRR